MSSPSAWREASTSAGNVGGRTNGSMNAWPCQAVTMNGASSAKIASVGRGSKVMRLVALTKRRLAARSGGERRSARRSVRARRPIERAAAATPADGLGFAFSHRRARRLVVGIEQAMQVDDEIAHARVVDRRLGLRLPGVVGGAVVRKDADDIELGEIGEADAVDAFEFAAEDQMEKLVGRLRLFPARLTHDGSRLDARLVCVAVAWCIKRTSAASARAPV